MQAIKKINNNFALCIDSGGVEMIAYGKGIGFGKFPCEVDLKQLDATYYNVNPQIMDMLSGIDERIFHVSSEIIAYAQKQFSNQIPNNFVFSLADHIQYAIERQKKRIRVKMPFAYEVEHLYKREFEIGAYALRLIRKELGVYLPREEITGIALHFINNYQQYAVETPEDNFEVLLEQVLLLIEDRTHICIDRSSYDCYRFSMHLRYFMKRAEAAALYAGKGEEELFSHMKNTNPETYEAMCDVQTYLEKELCIQCSTEEQLYLMIHINRLCTKEDCHRV